MSLFVDVYEVLSNRLKSEFLGLIEREKGVYDRSIRRICDVCKNYIGYGELRYDKMEDAISRLLEEGIQGKPFLTLLYAILHESLDEDEAALEHLKSFAASDMASPFRNELADFMTLGRFATLEDYNLLEEAATILMERYSTEEDINDILSNLYLKVEHDEYIPVFQRLLVRAKEKYPDNVVLEGFEGFINTKGKDYRKALESFMAVKDKVEQDKENTYFHFNMATAWNNIAGCYLKLGDLAATLVSCETALQHEQQSEDYKVGPALLYKKAEALLLSGEKDQASVIVKLLLDENAQDEKALELKGML
ncbi:MAG: tetratricopeptide repeat protein [Bacteroidales bacterium]|nr:tetratricopeptide repeat protein [Bacteroidales bacterium]